MPVDLRSLVAPGRVALVTQECQEGVVGPRSALPDLAAVAREGMLANVAALARAARAAAVPVLHATAERRPDGRGSNRNARLFVAVARGPVQLTPGSPEAAVVADVGVEPSDIVVPRIHGLSPMSGTGLDPILRNLGVTTIVGVGVSLNVAITNFAFDAVNLGYQFVIPRDAVAGVPREYGEAVLDNTLSVVATLTTTAEIVDAWAE